MFKEMKVEDFDYSAAKLIGKDWLLVTGEAEGKANAMTASWGGLGVMWGKNVAYIVLRPQRYTKEFVDREDYFTLSFFSAEYHKALGYLGSHSGRDEDKVSAVGFTPVFGENYTAFHQAELTLVCRKLFRMPLKEEYFLDKSIVEDCYPSRDFHDMYIGEIVKVLVKD